MSVEIYPTAPFGRKSPKWFSVFFVWWSNWIFGKPLWGTATGVSLMAPLSKGMPFFQLFELALRALNISLFFVFPPPCPLSSPSWKAKVQLFLIAPFKTELTTLFLNLAQWLYRPWGVLCLPKDFFFFFSPPPSPWNLRAFGQEILLICTPPRRSKRFESKRWRSEIVLEGNKKSKWSWETRKSAPLPGLNPELSELKAL